MTTDEIAEEIYQEIQSKYFSCDKLPSERPMMKNIIQKGITKALQSHPDSKLVEEIKRLQQEQLFLLSHEQKKDYNCETEEAIQHYEQIVELYSKLLQFSQEGTGK